MTRSPLHLQRAPCFEVIWHRPTFEGPCGPTIIGAGGLNCRVRDGNGWDPAAMGARNLVYLDPAAMASRSSSRSRREAFPQKLYREELSVPTTSVISQNFRAISTGQLHALRRFYFRPINVVVYHDSSPLRD